MSSGLQPKLLGPEALPPWEQHHGAKHKVLCEYTKAWLPMLGQTYPQTAVVDGFASAGREGNGRRERAARCVMPSHRNVKMCHPPLRSTATTSDISADNTRAA